MVSKKLLVLISILLVLSFPLLGFATEEALTNNLTDEAFNNNTTEEALPLENTNESTSNIETNLDISLEIDDREVVGDEEESEANDTVTDIGEEMDEEMLETNVSEVATKSEKTTNSSKTTSSKTLTVIVALMAVLLLGIINAMFGKSNSKTTESVKESLEAVLDVELEADASSESELEGEFDGEIEIPDSSTGIWGDPHYHLKNADGKKIEFDHYGTPGEYYKVFAGDNLVINGLYATYKDPKKADAQVIKEAEIKAGNDIIVYKVDGSATINGKRIKHGTHKLEDGTVVEYGSNKLNVISNESDSNVTVHKRSNKHDSYLDIDPAGSFGDMDGIVGKAMVENRALSNDECNEFLVNK